MLKTTIVGIIDFCTKHAYGTITVAVLIAVAAGYYAEEHFAINTDTDNERTLS